MASQLEKLQQSLDKKPSMLMEVSELKDIMVTKQQVLAVLNLLVQKLNDGEQRLSDMVENADTALKADVQKAKEEMTKMVTGVTKEMVTLNETMSSEHRTMMRMIDQKIDDVLDDLPEEYDDSELKAMIMEVKSEIPDLPEQFDASEIENTLAEHEKEIEELKKRPKGTVQGGVTNARITQAFKTILKTEQPVGSIDGVNTTYTVSQPIFAVFAFSLNGEVIAQLPNYTISGKNIEFSSALPAAYSGKDFEVKYI